jgi:hypothetical protein
MDKDQELRILRTMDVTNSLLRKIIDLLTENHIDLSEFKPVIHAHITQKDVEDNEHHFAPVHGWD